MPYRPHRLEPQYPGLDVVTRESPAPRIVVAVWCDMMATMDRVRLDAFPREIWRRFDHHELEVNYPGREVVTTKRPAPRWSGRGIPDPLPTVGPLGGFGV